MTPGQAAELRELLDYLHNGLRQILEDAVVNEKDKKVVIDQKAWKNLLTTQSDLSDLIRLIEDPQSSSTDAGQE